MEVPPPCCFLMTRGGGGEVNSPSRRSSGGVGGVREEGIFLQECQEMIAINLLFTLLVGGLICSVKHTPSIVAGRKEKVIK